LSGADRKAFAINAYNVLVIKSLVQRWPVASPMDVPGFFDGLKHQVMGRELTLDELERMLLAEFPDARLHFALCCGARGCPPLAPYAFRGEELDAQLDARTAMAVSDPRWVEQDGDKLVLSEIFNWYAKDFAAQGGSIAFINAYRDRPVVGSSIVFSTYDWKVNTAGMPATSAAQAGERINLQDITPSRLMARGQWELKLFNNLYTQTRGYDDDGVRVDQAARGTYNTLLVQALFGFKPRISLGFDAWVKSVRLGDEASSPLEVFGTERSNVARTALSGVGPKVKLQPFEGVPRLSVQSTFLLPVAKDQEGAENGGPFLSNDSYLWLTQVFYDLQVTRKVQVFAQVAPWFYYRAQPFSDGRSRASLSTPATVFLSWFPSQRLSFSVQQEYWPTWGDGGVSAWFRQEGLSAKLQVIPGLLELEVSHTRFTAGRNSGAGQTYNLGVRILR
jgi:hypothetical protein